MKFLDWVKDFFGVDQATVYVNQKAIATQAVQLAIEDFAITTAINMVASSISKCEIKTYLNKEEFKGEEYYLWNVEPNKNQNSSQFMQELVSKLLYYNECLVIDINGQLIIADDFFQKEYATLENYFTDVSRGDMDFHRTFRMSEVLYFKLSDTDVRALLSKLMVGYNNLLNMSIGKYKRSGGRKALARIKKTGTGDKEFEKKVDDLFNNRFKSYFEAENAVIHIPDGIDYEEQNGEGSKKSTSEIVDISAITKEVFERVAQAFKISPALLKGDIADIEKLTNNFLTFCIDPLSCMMQEEINRKRFGKSAFLSGSLITIDTTRIKHIDIFDIAEKIDKLIASGGFSIDDLRIQCGLMPINTDWSKKHWITKNYQDINNLEGGDISAKNNVVNKTTSK